MFLVSDLLFSYQFLQEPYVFLKGGYILGILVMKDFSFFRDEYDIIASGDANIGHYPVKPAPEKVTGHRRTGVLPRKYYAKAVYSLAIRGDICHESIRKKRFSRA